jgi:hypothetical protein
MDFGSIIKRSWTITWRFKALWVLGIFAGVSGCQGGGSSPSSGGGSTLPEGTSSMGTDFTNPENFRRLGESLVSWVPAIAAGIMLLVVIGIVWSIFSVAARGGLVLGTNHADDGRRVPLGQLWSSGFARFWSLVGLDILLKLPIVAVGLFMMVGVFAPVMGSLMGGQQPGAEVLFPICGSLAIGFPLLLILSFILGIMYLIALRYVMLGGQGAVEAAGNSWRFFRARFKDTFLMWLINAGLNIAASFAIAIPGVIVGIAVAVPAVVAGIDGNWGAVASAVGVAIIAFMLLGIAYSAVWGTYTSALWTLFFRDVTGMSAREIPVTPSGPPLQDSEPFVTADAPDGWSATPPPPAGTPAQAPLAAPPPMATWPPEPPAPPAEPAPAPPPGPDV